MKASTFVHDVRALGAGAPLRAAYEVSKRAGGHRVIFGALARRRPPPPAFAPVLAPPEGISPSAAQRTVDAATGIVGGNVALFGRDVALGSPPDWHGLLHAEGSWPRVPWWEIDVRSTRRHGDVKWAWELGRHRHLVILARAVHLTGHDEYRVVLEEHLKSWIRQNPPELGIHWYSNLEIALRAVAWI